MLHRRRRVIGIDRRAFVGKTLTVRSTGGPGATTIDGGGSDTVVRFTGGEGPTTAALAVVINAIVDALRDLGVEDVPMPATPYQVWRTIRDAQQQSA